MHFVVNILLALWAFWSYALSMWKTSKYAFLFSVSMLISYDIVFYLVRAQIVQENSHVYISLQLHSTACLFSSLDYLLKDLGNENKLTTELVIT